MRYNFNDSLHVHLLDGIGHSASKPVNIKKKAIVMKPTETRKIIDLIIALVKFNCFPSTTVNAVQVPKKPLMIHLLLFTRYQLINKNCSIAPLFISMMMKY